jgi:hypothetical protein
MDEVQILNHKGKTIVYIDFSTAKNKQKILDIIEEAKKTIKRNPLNSVLTLTDFTNLRFDSEIVRAIQSYAEENKPYVKAAALVGIIGLQKVVYNVISRITQRELPIYADKQEALDWLADK